MNRHEIVKGIKRLIYPKGERYFFNNKTLIFSHGTRPIRRKYRNSTNDVVRNDVLQIDFFESRFKSDDILWDIGSHHGHYSLFAASIVNGKNQVFSFEPDKAARQVQIINAGLNHFEDKISFFDIAVSDHEGQVQFMSLGGNANSHIVKDNSSQSSVISVQTKTIDALSTELPLPTYVKIDTEGAEIDILQKAVSLLGNSTVTFICELHPFAWESFNVRYETLVKTLAAFNRKMIPLDSRKKVDELPFYGTVIF